ncbi:bile acid:sodium symporter family protein [Persicobacter psychrovividus]|uniref:Bile acid:sodium symporter n=1 Tax=Persicobacter psychrovividus TaxID=387638 RepID=A0ABN6LG36_9BACT|nr:hypothetical protein PEPS_25770 [Persicobacter psychrovividus]
MQTKYKVTGLISVVAFLLFLYFQLTDITTWEGPCLITALLAMAITAKGTEKFSGFSYSLMILTAVAVSLYFPAPFVQVGSFQMKNLIVPLLQIIMFGMGSQMSLNDFAGVIKMPKGVLIGLCCQFTIMPIVGFIIIYIFNFPAEIAAGIILIGSSPSGMASNVMSFIAKANLALSVTITACATLLAPFMTPLLMKLLVGHMVAIDFWGMMIGIFSMVILPICAGLIFNMFMHRIRMKQNDQLQLLVLSGIILLKNVISFLTAPMETNTLMINFGTDMALFAGLPIALATALRYYQQNHQAIDLEKILSFISMAGIGLIITIITAAGRDSLLQVGQILILACLLHNCMGYTLGYGLSRLFRLKEQDCRTIALEVGMQNGGLASGIAVELGKTATLGLAAAIFGSMMNVTGSSLASWWRRRSPELPEDKLEKIPAELI